MTTDCTCTAQQLDLVGCDCHDGENFANACYISAYEDDAYEIERMQDKAHRGANLEYYGRDGLRTDVYLTEAAQRKAWTLQGHYDLNALYEALA